MTTLTIRDETVYHLANNDLVFVLDLPAASFTVRDLIRARVHREVQKYNAHQPDLFRGLVQPADAERTLNGFRLPKQHLIDWERQFEKAVEAFQRNGFIILVDDRQVDDLDTLIHVRPDTTVTFLKLVPLVGG